MVPLAPRYHPIVFELVRGLDDRTVPIAETARRVGEAVQLLGLVRPTYPHLRRLILAQRAWADAEDAYRAAVRGVLADVTAAVLTGRAPENPYVLAERIAEARRQLVS